MEPKTRDPGPRTQDPKTRLQNPVPGKKHTGLSTQDPGPRTGTWDLVPGTQYPEPSPGIWDPGSKNSRSTTQDIEPGTPGAILST